MTANEHWHSGDYDPPRASTNKGTLFERFLPSLRSLVLSMGGAGSRCGGVQNMITRVPSQQLNWRQPTQHVSGVTVSEVCRTQKREKHFGGPVMSAHNRVWEYQIMLEKVTFTNIHWSTRASPPAEMHPAPKPRGKGSLKRAPLVQDQPQDP